MPSRPQTFTPRTTILRKVLRQSVLLVAFCILLFGGLLFYIISAVLEDLHIDPSGAVYDMRVLGSTVLLLSILLLALAALLSALLARGIASSVQELSRKVRELRPGHWTFKRSVSTGDEIEMLDHVFADITRRLQHAYDSMKSDFILLASHQLRTPLSSIRWYVETLKGAGGNDQERQAAVREIDVAADRMAKLIEALLHVARLEGGDIEPHTEKIRLEGFLKKITDEWKHAVAEKNSTLKISLPPRNLSLKTDPILLAIVLQNLFINALKYSHNTPIIFTAKKEKSSLIMIVADHGLGIPKQEQRRIFEKFFRAKNVRAMDTDGTGLGLYMSKTIVENLGGTLTFESKEGEGSVFTVTLPLK